LWLVSSNLRRKSSLQPALRVLLNGRSIFLKRLLPRDDGRVSGDAEPRPLLESLPGTAADVSTTTTSSLLDVLVKKQAPGGSVVGSRAERRSPGRGEMVRLGRGDGGGRDTVAAVATDVPEVVTGKVLDVTLG